MKNLFIILLAILLFSCRDDFRQQIDLSGEWEFRTDPDDLGTKEEWYESDLPETVQLPGSMAENNKGNDITMQTGWTGTVMDPDWHNDPDYVPCHDPSNIRFPFWLQPVKKYTGAAWYIKKVTIPESWTGRTVRLILERPHWESNLWVNGEWTGSMNSLATPHIYNITSSIKPGENIIALRIDNRIKEVDPGINSHSITDHTQTNWNGIVGDILMEAAAKISFENINVFPDIDNKKVEIEAEIINDTDEAKVVKCVASARLKNTGEKVPRKSWKINLQLGKNIVKMTLPLGDKALLWDEFNPDVYQLSLTVKYKKEIDNRTVDFGLREFKAEGTRFFINGRPVFLRGTLECAIFPKTGYPPTETAGWEKVYTAVKAHGLNHVRFHSWCPPEAAFEAADKMGIYLHVECSSWANSSTVLGSGLPIDQYIYEESRRIVRTYGNHPSFVMMAYGNEPGGPHHKEYLAKFVKYWKEKDNRRVYTSGAGWPLISENDFHSTHSSVRIQGWGEELNSIINSEPPRTDYDWSKGIKNYDKPVVSHEIGQWCVYPDFKEIKKYTGVLKAKNFEMFRESLIDHDMGHLADSFLLASGKLQALCYKADIEAALRTPGFAGFQLLDLHDFPGQGTALVGVLDPFWEEKGYISPAEYRSFCNTTVPLARLEKRIFTEGETLTADIEVAHFGKDPLPAVNPSWEITHKGEAIAGGTLGVRDISIGNAINLGQIIYRFQKNNLPRKLNLKITVQNFSNSWDIWVFPQEQPEIPEGIKIVETLGRPALEFLANGGKILLSLGKGKVASSMGGDVGVGFSSIFWNTAWTRGQKPHTLGILCNPGHPALELFPAEYHSNWQWWDAMSHADAVQLDSFSYQMKPIVRIIDDWVSNRQLALIFEAKAGKGRIIVCGADLMNDLETRPEARQLRASLLKYMASNEFNPSVEIKTKELLNILKN